MRCKQCGNEVKNVPATVVGVRCSECLARSMSPPPAPRVQGTGAGASPAMCKAVRAGCANMVAGKCLGDRECRVLSESGSG